MQLTLTFDPPNLVEVFERVYRRLEFKFPVKSFKVRFHPYANLRSTVRLRECRIEARISDVAAGASPIVLEALAEVLLAPLFRRKPSPEARDCYGAWSAQPAVQERISANRRARGFKLMAAPRGQYHDLDTMFQQLNHDHFQGRLAVPKLGWSPQRSRTMLGHYDASHGSITISRILDSPRVPTPVVEYVLYHEMLHMVYPVQREGHRRRVHTREFLEAERRFPNYQQVEGLLRHSLKGLPAQRCRRAKSAGK